MAKTLVECECPAPDIYHRDCPAHQFHAASGWGVAMVWECDGDPHYASDNCCSKAIAGRCREEGCDGRVHAQTVYGPALVHFCEKCEKDW